MSAGAADGGGDLVETTFVQDCSLTAYPARVDAQDPVDPDLTGATVVVPGPELAALIVQRLRWPADERPENGAALDAKVAVIDGSTGFITSANLTKRAEGDNLEAGVLIRGGDIPERLVAHVREHRKQGRLTPA